MPIRFRAACAGSLLPLTAEVPSGAIVGVVGLAGSGSSDVAGLASGILQPLSGEMDVEHPARSIGPAGPLEIAPARSIVLRHAFGPHDSLARARARVVLEMLRRDGASILIESHDQHLLRDLCDEVWWFDRGQLALAGDPGAVLEAYNQHAGQAIAEWGRTVRFPLSPSLRRGDGRATLERLETLDHAGRPTSVWQSGRLAKVRAAVRFAQAVEDPVVGIMIRTRIGFEVFGTNTELEKVKLGPVRAGDSRIVTFTLQCSLCPQEYTITAASHDPDGVWHDWIEDAVAVAVAAPRYTAGVADLRAQVEVES